MGKMTDPKFIFWLGVVVTVEQAIAGGTLHLTNMVPEAWIPTITAWCAFLAFVGTAVMTGLTGFSSTKPGPLVSAPPQSNVTKSLILILCVAAAWFLIVGSGARAADLPVTRGQGPVAIGGSITGGQAAVLRPKFRQRHRPAQW